MTGFAPANVNLDQEPPLSKIISGLNQLTYKDIAKGRNQTNLKQEIHQYTNFILLYGSAPKLSVDVDTTMVKDIIDVIKCRIDQNNRTITLPDVFENLKGTDARFEMVTSNTLQPLQLSLNAGTA